MDHDQVREPDDSADRTTQVIELEQSLENRLAQETRQRELLEMYENEDWKGLLAAAEQLNAAYSMQLALTSWLAAEAADSVSEAWQASRKQWTK